MKPERMQDRTLPKKDLHIASNGSALLPEADDYIDFETEFGWGTDSLGRRIYRVSIEG